MLYLDRGHIWADEKTHEWKPSASDFTAIQLQGKVRNELHLKIQI